jgi:hypothetical protein
MASIRVETVIEADPSEVWSALRDWGALHERLAPGFATDLRLEDGDRIVTFFDGTVVREVKVDVDEDARRLAWAIVGGPYAHHNASAQIGSGGDGRATFTWQADLLPDALAERTRQMMERGTATIRETLERSA